MDSIICTKKAHYSKQEAIFFQKKSAPVFFRTYECPNCGLIHVSTQLLNTTAHLDILATIKQKKQGAVLIGNLTPDIQLYCVDHKDCKYLVHYFIRERTIKIIEETLWDQEQEDDGKNANQNTEG